MARYIGSVCRLCRREGLKLFFKGKRCHTDKCSFDRRSYAPGQHGQRHPKLTPYGLQLREKQKLRRIYGLLERQFRRYFRMAERMKGATGENLLQLLERRLDNTVFRLGFATTRVSARQLIRHGHFLVNGEKVDLPSYLLRVGDVVEVAERSRGLNVIKEAIELAKGRAVPSWLEVDYENFKGTVVAIPTKEEAALPVQEQLVVELYSK